MSVGLVRAPLLALLTCAVLAAAQATGPIPEHIVGGDNLARKLASMIVRPRYPAAAVRVGATGPAVALIEITPTGVVAKLSILQAPDAAIGSALIKALNHWSFRPLPVVNGKRYGAFLTVVYYFELIDGKPRVLTPREAPVIGPGKHRRNRGQ